MDERKEDLAEDAAKDLEDLEVTELDDKDIEGVAGGQLEVDLPAGDNNLNCGCNGEKSSGGSGNTNCGC